MAAWRATPHQTAREPPGTAGCSPDQPGRRRERRLAVLSREGCLSPPDSGRELRPRIHTITPGDSAGATGRVLLQQRVDRFDRIREVIGLRVVGVVVPHL